MSETKAASQAKTATLAGLIGAAVASALVSLVALEESGSRKYHRAYLDVANVATICDGLTRYADGSRVKISDSRTEAQCQTELAAALFRVTSKVLDCTPQLRGRDNQVVAASSLAYNIGERAYCNSTIARHFRAGEFRAGCNGFMAWNKARVNGVLRPVKGLTSRRARERAICLRGL